MARRVRSGRRLTRREAAEFLGVKEAALHAWASNGRYRLPYIKIGNKVFYWESDLLAFLEDREVA